MSPRGRMVLVLGVLLLAAPGATAGSLPALSQLPPPAFRPASGWWTVTTGPTDAKQQVPQVWAITIRSNLAALVPFDLFRA